MYGHPWTVAVRLAPAINVTPSATLSAHEGPDHRQDVSRSLPQSAGEVREPARAVRDDLEHPVPPPHEVVLQGVANAEQHLELEPAVVPKAPRDRVLAHRGIVPPHRSPTLAHAE